MAGVGTASQTSPRVKPVKRASSNGFSSPIPSAFWSIGAPFWSRPNEGAEELTVIDQLTSVPALFARLSLIES